MLEIFALVFLSKKIAELAEQKGESPKKWKTIVIVSWFATEILGAILFAFTVGIDDDNILILALVAMSCGLISFLIIRTILASKPDAMHKLSEES